MAERVLATEVNRDVLRWARVSAGLGLPTVARRFKHVEQWERGKGVPSISQLESLSDLYQRPLAVFFLEHEPDEPALPTDFRTIAGGDHEYTKGVRLAIRMARRTQRLYGELEKALREERTTSGVPVLRKTEDPERAAHRVRTILGVNIGEQRKWPDYSAAFRNWRASLDGLGVLVLQQTMPVKEARGFSLNGGALPVVVLNSSDVVQAKIFTLFHELAHLGLRTPGVCLPRLDETAAGPENVESFCNQFSGALLVPLSALQGTLPNRGADDETIEEAIRPLASQLKVSRYVMLFRFLSAEAVSKSQFQRIFDKWELARIETPTRTKGGPPPHVKALSRLGPRFISSVLDAHSRGFITTSDVADYLSLKTRHLPQLQQMLATERRG